MAKSIERPQIMSREQAEMQCGLSPRPGCYLGVSGLPHIGIMAKPKGNVECFLRFCLRLGDY